VLLCVGGPYKGKKWNLDGSHNIFGLEETNEKGPFNQLNIPKTKVTGLNYHKI